MIVNKLIICLIYIIFKVCKIYYGKEENNKRRCFRDIERL